MIDKGLSLVYLTFWLSDFADGAPGQMTLAQNGAMATTNVAIPTSTNVTMPTSNAVPPPGNVATASTCENTQNTAVSMAAEQMTRPDDQPPVYSKH